LIAQYKIYPFLSVPFWYGALFFCGAKGINAYNKNEARYSRFSRL
jgi:hypothetical protein